MELYELASNEDLLRSGENSFSSSGLITRGSAEHQAGKERFYWPGMGAVCAAEPQVQFSVAMAHAVVTGGKMFRHHRGNICTNYDTTRA